MISSLGNQYLSSPNEMERLKKACEDFEAIFTQQMFKTMRASSFESELIKKNQGEKVFTDMMDGEVAKMASSGSAGGVAQMLFEQLKTLMSEAPEEDTGKKFPNKSGTENLIQLKQRGFRL